MMRVPDFVCYIIVEQSYIVYTFVHEFPHVELKTNQREYGQDKYSKDHDVTQPTDSFE